MPCFHPMVGYRSIKKNPGTGKRSIVFDSSKGIVDLTIPIPCGQCIGCRLERSRQWAMRCVHEASGFENNAYLTLTYDDKNLPQDKSVHIEHFQKFMKRLRKKFKGIEPVKEPDGKTHHPLRFFHCGEYGTQCRQCLLHKNYCTCPNYIPMIGRPHYHALLFNFDFNDKLPFTKNKTGETLFTSETLSKIWGLGFCTLGDVTFESAAYVARYITKKINGPMAKKEQTYVRYETEKSPGEISVEVNKEYTSCSRRPGLGTYWYRQFSEETYRDDFVLLRGKKMRPPKYYDKKLEGENPRESFHIKVMRKSNARKHSENNTPERLAVREFCQQEKFNRLKRGLE